MISIILILVLAVLIWAIKWAESGSNVQIGLLILALSDLCAIIHFLGV